jgi:hypothetical protein
MLLTAGEDQVETTTENGDQNSLGLLDLVFFQTIIRVLGNFCHLTGVPEWIDTF